MDSYAEIKFCVKGRTSPGELFCVVGDCPELGEWNPHKAKRLSLQRHTDDGEIWSKTVKLPINLTVKYRYFLAHVRDTDCHEVGDEPDVMVIFWETNVYPRTINCSLQNESSGSDVFGYYSGQKSISKGWLIDQSEVQMRVHSNPIHMYKAKYSQQTYSIKCTALDLRRRDSVDSPTEGVESFEDFFSLGYGNKIRVSVLNKDQHHPVDQKEYGTVYKENDYMIFRVQTFDSEYLGYHFEFYVHDHNGGSDHIPRFIGNSYIVPQNLHSTSGVATTLINGLKHKPIGRFTIDYLKIKPMRRFKCNMEVSYARYWKHSRRALDVGHRGMGSTFNSPMKMRQCEFIKENTIQSLTEAGRHGADFVEFDVQLTKDKIPVIYHDFAVAMTLKKKYSEDHDWFELPVHELSLEQIQMLKLDHVSEKSKGSPSTSPVEFETVDRQTFPQLKLCLQRIDPHIGFNIEVKYCMRLKTGQMEEGLKYFYERNEYLDIILSEVLQYAGERRIIFSSFDPDICSMIQLKQNKYPIMLISPGNTDTWEPYQDIRCHDALRSMYFTNGERLLGIVLHSEDLFIDSTLMSEGKLMSLILFCWGKDSNSKENIKTLKDMGVDGVIFDKIGEIRQKKENVFKLENDKKLRLLHALGLLQGDMTDGYQEPLAVETVQTNKNVSNLARSYSEDTGKVVVFNKKLS